jgi:PAS domain S-box-containing protein
MKSKTATILIVDDMATNIQALSSILKNEYEIHVALNGKKAIELIFANKKPDLILLDVVMPEMDGYEVCRHLKSNPDTAEIPIIFVTAKSEAEDEEEAFRVGAVDYITKPFSPSTILARVNTHITLKGHEEVLKKFNQDLSEQVESELSGRVETQKRYQHLFESSPIPVFIYQIVNGKRGKLEEVNEAAQKLTGYTKDELMDIDPLALHPVDSISKIPLCFGTEATQFEIGCLRKEGTVAPVLIFASPFNLSDKQMVYSYWTDLSHIKQMEEERLLKDRLLTQQTKLASMGEMIGAIAHQWRQPLNSLGIVVQDVEYAYKYSELDDEYIKKFKMRAMETINYMSKTIDDFKNFFSPNKKEEQFFLEDAVTQTLSMLSAQLKNNSIEIYFDIDETKKHQYICNKNELSQVILNILANAKDALIEKKPTNPFIKIDIYDDDSGYILAIEDSAGGVPQDAITKVFDSYFTTKQDSGGTGIGLYMSKTIIEEHLGGRLELRNTQNGAIFIVWLPKQK